jgi:MFS family permease
VLAATAWLTLREPKQLNGAAELTVDRDAMQPSGVSPDIKTVFMTLWRNQTFRLLLCAWSLSTLLESGIAQWTAAFFVRSHGVGTGELGTWLSWIWLLSMIGVYAGGELATRYAPNNEKLQLGGIAIAFAVYGVLSVGIYLAPNIEIAFAIKAICTLGVVATVAPTLAILISLVPPTMRAMSMAVLILISNLIGMGVGPLAVGALSDALIHLFGQESLRYALVVATPGYVLVGICVWRARPSVRHDLAQIAA